IDWFLFGKRAAAMVSATLGVRQSEADYADMVRQRVLATATAFYDVLEAKGLLELAQQDVQNLSKLEAVTEKAAARGVGGRSKLDLNRVRLELLKSRQALREAELTLANARAKLRALLGRTDPDPSFDVTGTLEAPLTFEPPAAEEAYAM